jgi:hypothetical protein
MEKYRIMQTILTSSPLHRRIAAFPSSRFAARRIRAGFEVCNLFGIDTGNQSIFHVAEQTRL